MSSAPLEKGANMAAIGWLEMGSKRDAVELARGYAARHMNSQAACWYAVAPLLGGWIWEVQEGGNGKSHIPDVIKALSAGAERSWFRVGRRAYTVSMRDGRPFCVLVPERESREILESGENRLSATGKMVRVVKTGMGVFAVGMTLFIGGGVFLGAAGGYYALSQQYVPMDRQVSGTALPHNQWSKVQNVPPNLYVETLRLKEGEAEWQAVIKPIQQAPAQAPAAEPAPDVGAAASPGGSVPVVDAAPAEAVPPVEIGQSDVPAAPVPPSGE